MKFTVASVALLAVTASATNVKRQSEDKVLTIDIGSKIDDLTSKVNDLTSKIVSIATDVGNLDPASSKVSELISDVASKATAIASDVRSVGDKITSGAASRASEITSFVGSAVADGITINIPALPTASVNTEALNNYISSVQSKFDPTIISQIKAGQTPAVVTSFIDSLPTEYKTVASAAFSDAAKQTGTPSNNGGSASGSDDKGSAAPGRSMTGLMAAVCVGVAGLAIYL